MGQCLESKEVKTRKEHKCWGCLKKIEKGSQAERNTSVDENGIFSCYYCIRCRDMCYKCQECFNSEDANKGHAIECVKARREREEGKDESGQAESY